MRARRLELGLRPAYKRIDTCAAEFESLTPYLYGTYEQECEAAPTPRRKVVILGSGPNRIGQGIEFDYCCVHAAFALRDAGLETVMVNCNPETVSTDYDTVDRLYFEPLTLEDVLAIVEQGARAGRRRCRASCSSAARRRSSWRCRCRRPASRSSARRPTRSTSPRTASASRSCSGTSASRSRASGMADVARRGARRRRARSATRWSCGPSYVLGGRAMAIVYDPATLDRYMTHAPSTRRRSTRSSSTSSSRTPSSSTSTRSPTRTGAVVIGGIMEHIEEAGIHSGDSSCVVPPYLVAEQHLATIRDYTRRIAKALNVIGLMNAQFAIKDDVVYVLEVNPRASRTVPYLSKATGVPLAKVAARADARARRSPSRASTADLEVSGVFVKTPVFPFVRFPGVDTLLGPEMKSTGEVMGGGRRRSAWRSPRRRWAPGRRCRRTGTAFISVNNDDKPNVLADRARPGRRSASS